MYSSMWLGSLFAFGKGLCLQQAAFLDGISSVRQQLERLRQGFEFDFRQETQMTEVHAEDRHVDFHHVPGHAQEGAVPAQGDRGCQPGVPPGEGLQVIHFRNLFRRHHRKIELAAKGQDGFKVDPHFDDAHIGKDSQTYIIHYYFLLFAAAVRGGG